MKINSLIIISFFYEKNELFIDFLLVKDLFFFLLQIFLLLYLMYYQLGYSAIIGAAAIYILAPIQYYVSTQLSKLQKQELVLRIKLRKIFLY